MGNPALPWPVRTVATPGGRPGDAKPGAARADRFAYRRRPAPLTTERWYDVVYHVCSSQSALLAVVDVRLDGRPVVANLHPPGGTVYPGRSEHREGTYRREGLHHDRSIPVGTVYLANQRLGSSYAGACPRLPGR